MSKEIYYFSGTGNSLAAARDIAKKTSAKLIAVPSVIHKQSIAVGADILGIVFPVYHGSIPLIIKRFFQRVETLKGTYIFAVCTYGDSSQLAVEHLDKLIRSRGGQLAAGYAVQMPYNYLTPSFSIKSFFSSFTLREIAERNKKLYLPMHRKRLNALPHLLKTENPVSLK